MTKKTYVKGDRYYGNTASRYQVKREKQSWWHVEQREMQLMLKKLPDNLKVVDIPFGTGRFVKFYNEKNFEVHGLDASNEMIEQAKRELGDEYGATNAVTGTSTALPFSDDEFDLLVSTRFMHSIIVFSDVKKTLTEFSRVTKHHAILQLGISVKPVDDYPKDNERMDCRLSREELDALLAKHKFEITDQALVKDDEENGEIYNFLCRVSK